MLICCLYLFDKMFKVFSSFLNQVVSIIIKYFSYCWGSWVLRIFGCFGKQSFIIYIFANIFKCFSEVNLTELVVGSAILWSEFGGKARKWCPVSVFPFSIQVAWSLRSWMLYCGSVWQTLKTLQAHLAWGGREKQTSGGSLLPACHEFSKSQTLVLMTSSLFFYCEKQEDPLSQTPVVSQKVF